MLLLLLCSDPFLLFHVITICPLISCPSHFPLFSILHLVFFFLLIVSPALSFTFYIFPFYITLFPLLPFHLFSSNHCLCLLFSPFLKFEFSSLPLCSVSFPFFYVIISLPFCILSTCFINLLQYYVFTCLPIHLTNVPQGSEFTSGISAADKREEGDGKPVC